MARLWTSAFLKPDPTSPQSAGGSSPIFTSTG
jgi:hypothetical protein